MLCVYIFFWNWFTPLNPIISIYVYRIFRPGLAAGSFSGKSEKIWKPRDREIPKSISMLSQQIHHKPCPKKVLKSRSLSVCVLALTLRASTDTLASRRYILDTCFMTLFPPRPLRCFLQLCFGFVRWILF